MNNIPVITVDGASGTGKGVVTHRLAVLLGWHLLDSGILYRALGLSASQHGMSVNSASEKELAALASSLDIHFVAPLRPAIPHIILEGKDVTAILRTERMGDLASRAGSLSAVRAALLERQRAFRLRPGLVTDGRDMGTVVFPDAQLKVFLSASLPERVRRRYLQLKAQGVDVTLGALEKQLSLRDVRDSSRAIAPLRPAEDAVCIDTDQLTIDEVVERIIDEVKKRHLDSQGR